eukprot:jgi/Botrbrau1/13678/Bobra.0378s0009.2
MQGFGQHSFLKLYRHSSIQRPRKPLTPPHPERAPYLGGVGKNLLASRRNYEFPVREHSNASVRSADLEQPLLARTSGNGVSKIDETLKSLDFLIKPSANDSQEGVFESTDDGQGDQSSSPTTGNRGGFEVKLVEACGKVSFTYKKRRDLLKDYRLQPRDIRRIEPLLSLVKSSSTITVKENVILFNVGGLRLIIAADMMLVFGADEMSRDFADNAGKALSQNKKRGAQVWRNAKRGGRKACDTDEDVEHPFELEMLERALSHAIGQLEKRFTEDLPDWSVLSKLEPVDFDPMKLEALRKCKQVLVELESKADTIRDMLEELIDDEDEIRDMNLSSRPLREERRRQRERERIERGRERCDFLGQPLALTLG